MRLGVSLDAAEKFGFLNVVKIDFLLLPGLLLLFELLFKLSDFLLKLRIVLFLQYQFLD